MGTDDRGAAPRKAPAAPRPPPLKATRAAAIARTERVRALRDSVRGDYESGRLGIAEIAVSVGRHPVTIQRWADLGEWRAPEGGAASTSPLRDASATVQRRLVMRLLTTFERQLRRVERRAAREAPGEADVRVVAALARTLDTLLDLDRTARDEAAKAAAADGAEEIDADALRGEIARRLQSLGAG